jgi:hypothetical protein
MLFSLYSWIIPVGKLSKDVYCSSIDLVGKFVWKYGFNSDFSSQFFINLRWELSWNLDSTISIFSSGFIKFWYLFSLFGYGIFVELFSLSVFIFFGR